MHHILISFRGARFIVCIPTKRSEERVNKLPAQARFIVGVGSVSIHISVESLDEIDDLFGSVSHFRNLRISSVR